jgi:hypothetical protein
MTRPAAPRQKSPELTPHDVQHPHQKRHHSDTPCTTHGATPDTLRWATHSFRPEYASFRAVKKLWKTAPEGLNVKNPPTGPAIATGWGPPSIRAPLEPSCWPLSPLSSCLITCISLTNDSSLTRCVDMTYTSMAGLWAAVTLTFASCCTSAVYCGVPGSATPTLTWRETP